MDSLSLSASRTLFTPGEWGQLADHLGLPKRQEQIAFLILSGYGDKQIATSLGIGLPTVRAHVGRLLRRLNVRNRQEVILNLFLKFWALRLRLSGQTASTTVSDLKN